MAYRENELKRRMDYSLRSIGKMVEEMRWLQRSGKEPAACMREIERLVKSLRCDLPRDMEEVFMREVGRLMYHKPEPELRYRQPAPQNFNDKVRDVEFTNEFLNVNEFLSLEDLAPSRTYQNKTVQSFVMPPELVLIQFVGGVLNAEQRFFKLSEHSYLRGASEYIHAILGDVTAGKDDNIIIGTETRQRYKLVPIPLAETKWLPDHQIVIGVFIE